MTYLSLRQFQHITGISDAALGCLLRESLVPCSLSKEGHLQINADAVEIKKLMASITAAKQAAFAAYEDIAIEKLASIISRNMEGIIDQVLTELTQEAAPLLNEKNYQDQSKK